MNRKKIIEEACVFFLVFLFVYAASAKILGFRMFRAQLELYPWIRHMAGMIAWGIPLLEIVVAALLIPKRKRIVGFIVSFILLILFTVYLLLMLATEQHLPCSCGGVIEGLSWKQHVFFNLFFIGISGLGIFIYHPLKLSL